MGELSDYGSLADEQLVFNSQRDIDFKELEGNLLIFHKLDCDAFAAESRMLEQVRSQFAKRPDVRIFAIGECVSKLDKRISQGDILRKIDCQSDPEACARIEQTVFREAENEESGNVAFIDGNLHIRNYYHSDLAGENKRLIEHMAMMLPDERQKYGKENQEE